MEKSGVKAATPARKRVLYFSVLNVIACFGVVLLHCNGDAFWNFARSKTWISANFIEAIYYFPVPIFFMLSGATLLEYRKRYSTKVFMKKRFAKTLIPFLFWSLIAMLYASVVSGVFDWHPLHIIDNILNTRYMPIFGFFISLFALYLSIPVLSAIDSKIRMKVYKFAIMLALIFISILPLVCHLCKIEYAEGYIETLVPPVVGGYVIFVLIGYYLNKVTLNKKQRRLIYVAGIFGVLLHFVGCWVFSYHYNEVNLLFKGYGNLPSVLGATAVFVFFKYLNYDKILRKLPWLEKLFHNLAGLTFGVYLIHGFIVGGLPLLFNIDTYGWMWRIFGTIGVFALCIIISWIIKKIPILRQLVP